MPNGNHLQTNNKLSDDERRAVLNICHQKDFASLPPCQIVPKLADEGIYIASESTFYRILGEEHELKHRLRSKPPRKVGPPRSHCATRPNELWAWDITWLKGPITGMFFFLYLFIDVYSRKIVGWEIYEREDSKLSAKVVHIAILAEGAIDSLNTLHADNGSAQKGSTLLAKLEALGIAVT